MGLILVESNFWKLKAEGKDQFEKDKPDRMLFQQSVLRHLY